MSMAFKSNTRPTSPSGMLTSMHGTPFHSCSNSSTINSRNGSMFLNAVGSVYKNYPISYYFSGTSQIDFLLSLASPLKGKFTIASPLDVKLHHYLSHKVKD